MDQSSSPVVILEVDESNMGFAIWIGPFEAESLALAVSGESFQRPLTYDLFIESIKSLGGKFEKAVIHSVRDNIYYASLYVTDSTGNTKSLDARPSDCLVLAAKCGFPVFVEESVFTESAIDLSKLQGAYESGEDEKTDKDEDQEFKEFVKRFDIEDLREYFERRQQENDEDEDAEDK